MLPEIQAAFRAQVRSDDKGKLFKPRQLIIELRNRSLFQMKFT
jgi:hypothetical protein